MIEEPPPTDPADSWWSNLETAPPKDEVSLRRTAPLPSGFDKPSLITDYTDAAGLPILRVCRWDKLNGKAKKDFKQFTWDGDGWVTGQHGRKPTQGWPLSRLPEMIASPNAPVLLVEGEKKAIKAQEYAPDGYIVVSWPGGSSAFNSIDVSPLAQRRVVFWPDLDKAGQDSIPKIEARVPHAGIVTIPELFQWECGPLKKQWNDLGDPLAPGATPALVQKLILDAVPRETIPPESPAQDAPPSDDPRFEEEPEQPAQPLPPLEGILPHLSWSDTNIPVRKWVVEGIVPARTVTLLQGDGGLGKSLLTLQLAHACATGRPWLEQTTRPCKVFALYCEDDPDELQRRLHSINEHYRQIIGDDLPGHGFSELENMLLASRVGYDNLLMAFAGGDGGPGVVTQLLAQISQSAHDFGAELIILDSLHDLFGGNENNRVQARQFVNGLQKIALQQDGAVILNAHPSAAGLSSGSGTSGSTAWNNSVRSRLYMSRKQEDGRSDPIPKGPVTLQIMKANYAAIGTEIELEWRYGFFIPKNLPSQPVNLSNRKASVESAFLACLALAKEQNRPATYAYNSRNFAGKIFPGMPCSGGYTKRDFADAMQRLINSDRIHVVSKYDKKSKHEVDFIEPKDPPKSGWDSVPD